jgi:WD40 repeat protein
VATGQLLLRMGGHANIINQADLTPDGRFLITGDGKSVRIWRVADGELLSTVVAKSFNLSPSGRYLVLNGAETVGGPVVPGGPQVVTPPQVARLVWSPDAVHLLLLNTTGWSQTRIWDAATGQISAVLAGAELGAYWGAFSPDGRQVVTALTNATAGVWDAASGRLLSELEAGPGSISQAVFSPDGRLLAALFTYDKTAGLWDVATGRLLAVSVSMTGTSSATSGSPLTHRPS